MEKKSNWLVDFLKGGSLGTGILPGVSMGTVGLIVDVYDKMIDNIDNIRKKGHFKKSFLTLLPIVLGLMIFTILLMVFWNNLASIYFPFLMICILAGFVIGGYPIMHKEIHGKTKTVGGFLRIIISFLFTAGIGVAAFLMNKFFYENPNANTPFFMNMSLAVYDPFSSPYIYPIMLALGLLSAVASIVPGVSGAMIMFITGLYNPIISLLIDKDLSIFFRLNELNTGLWWGQATGLLTLVVGIVAGFFLTSSLMKNMLEHHRVGTFQIVCGFVLGSIVSMFFNNDMGNVYFTWTSFDWEMVAGPIALIASALITHLLLKYKSKASKTE